MSEAEDLRHNVRVSAPIPVATEPPREPATPRPIDTVREQREADRRDEAVKERRAKALELAVTISTVGAQDRPLLPLADVFLRYIETGEHTA